MKILVTGATGFIGNAIITRLCADNIYEPIAGVRNVDKNFFFNCPITEIGELGPTVSLPLGLNNVEIVVHAAARVHIANEYYVNALEEFRSVNVYGTLQLAKQAAIAGVKRFIFISSIKVNGNQTELGCPITSSQFPNPKDPYEISKYEAEVELKSLAKESGMEVVIIRPPLVYGPGVKANFLSMMNWLMRGVPLPLGSITENRRSFVNIDNLVSLIVACINSPAAANQTLLVSDGEDLSTRELLERMALSLGRPARLIPIPTTLIALAGGLIGRDNIQRLCGSLQVDITKTKDMLGWAPSVSVDEGLRQTATHFLRFRG